MLDIVLQVLLLLSSRKALAAGDITHDTGLGIPVVPHYNSGHILRSMYNASQMI